MIPTLYARNLDSNFLNFWGCVVSDECHRMPAEQFFSVVNHFLQNTALVLLQQLEETMD